MSSEKLIEVRRVSKIYKNSSKVAALSDLSVDFHRGEFTAIAGPSGSGKSTLLNLIGALDHPTHGDIRFKGTRLSDLDASGLAKLRLRSMGFVFQSFNLIPVLTALENVEYPLVLQEAPKAERREKALQALRWVGLQDYAKRRPEALSGGQQQRVAVARAIMHSPDVVLADEPTANLDSKTAQALVELMHGLNQERGATFLFSSHDPAILKRARRVVEIHDGKLARDSAA